MISLGTFYGVDIGSTALASAQVGQDVTGHNISNSGTIGYSDETANLAANTPTGPGPVGSGVSVASITRAQDEFLTVQVRNAYSNQGNLNGQGNWLGRIQTAFTEPGANTLNSSIGALFNSFETVQNNPEDNGIRVTVIQAGDTLAGQFHAVQSELDSAGTQITTQLGNDMMSVNTYGQQIANLNIEIRKAVAEGVTPNDLMDQRDMILDSLSKLVNISTNSNPDSTIDVSIASTTLVSGVTSNTVDLPTLQSRGDLQSGEAFGLSQTLSDLASNQTQLDQLAGQIITSVNAQHAQGAGIDGTTGINFFVGTGARDIGMNSVLEANPQKLAVAAVPTAPATIPPPGDGSNAGLIATLKDIPLASGPLAGQTFQSFYDKLVTQLAAQGGDVKTRLTTANSSTAQLSNQKSSLVGVNQDEELTKMMKFQRMYQAAAKYIATQDSMLDTLINSMIH